MQNRTATYKILIIQDRLLIGCLFVKDPDTETHHVPALW